jgi:hypothetical protein
LPHKNLTHSHDILSGKDSRGVGKTGLASGLMLTVFNYPGAASTQPLRINDSGVIVGAYSVGNAIQGFIRHSDGTLAQISYPGSTSTVPESINNAGDQAVRRMVFF